ncbi:MAG: papain-like cysteine protease family protein [Opitutaceae bacterium]
MQSKALKSTRFRGRFLMPSNRNSGLKCSRVLSATRPPGAINSSELLQANRVPYHSLLKELLVLGKLFSRRAPGFTIQSQTQSNWCWAATSVSVSHFYWTGSSWTQCQVASDELGRTDCCNSPVPSPCNVPWFLDRALTRTNNFVSITGQITFAQVQAEIDAGRPVGARVGWSGGGGHFMVIYGYRTVGTTRYFDIADPIYGNSSPTVATFSSSYQGAASPRNFRG